MGIRWWEDIKVTITDSKALAKISPSALRVYLESNGWYEAHYVEATNASIWQNGDSEFIAPNDTEIGDYVARISDAIKEIERAEGRTQLAIYKDLWDLSK